MPRRVTPFVATLGDALLDVVTRMRAPLARGADTPSTITLSAGGQAANVAAWVAVLGGRARFIGRRADDLAGAMVAAELTRRGVELAGTVATSGTGVLVSLVDPAGERSMLPDRGSATEVRAEDLDPAWLEDVTHLHVSGYALYAEPVCHAAAALAALARDRGIALSVDLASWSEIERVGADRVRTLVSGLVPAVVFANDEETAAVGGVFGEALWIRKRGAAGCVFGLEARPALPVEAVVDTTGAGDALAAGWLVGGADLALEAAARCVQTVGAMPEFIASL